MTHPARRLPLPDGRALTLGREPVMMGIVNVTPDSFSDGGRHADPDAAVAQALVLLDDGAAIVDVGGESTRPGAEAVPVQAELDRVMPVLDRLHAARPEALMSIDTYKALVADQAIQAGAAIVNDVHGLQRDPDMAAVVALHRVPVILMHWDVDRDSNRDLIDEMKRYFGRSLEIAAKAGIAPEAVVLDPGFGFGKSLDDNYQLLRRLPELAALGYPLLAGTSRKSMIGRLVGGAPGERLAGTLATQVLAYLGGAQIFRVHEIVPNEQALRIAQATLYGPEEMDHA